MVKETVIRAVGNSAGMTIPKPMLERFHLQEGDAVYLIETERGVLVTPYDPNFEQMMAAYAVGSKRFRHAMAALAKQ